MEKVSVIVPVYNTKKEYLIECIGSLMYQTYSNIEVILVDDGSNKEVADECDCFEKKYKKIKVLHQENGGISVARNKGLKNATGKWVLFIDSDDWLEKNAIEKLVLNSRNADVTLGKFYKDNEKCYDDTVEMIIIGEDRYQLFNSMFKDRNIKYNNAVYAWAKLYSREFLVSEKITFTEEIRTIGEDWVFNFEIYNKAKKIVLIPDFVYHYRTNEESVMNSFDKNFVKKYERFLKKIIDSFGEIIEKKYRKEMDYFIIWCLHRYCYSYFFSKENDMKKEEKLSQLKIIAESNLYNRAIKRINLFTLPPRRFMLVSLLRMKVYFLLPFLY